MTIARWRLQATVAVALGLSAACASARPLVVVEAVNPVSAPVVAPPLGSPPPAIVARRPPIDTVPAVVQQGTALVVDAAATADSAKLTADDVTRGALALFGDSLPPSIDSVAAPPTWDIDVRSYEGTARVKRFVDLLTGSAKERTVARLERGTRYEQMIRGQLRAAGLPEDMYFLAMIESSFDVNAYSKAAAVGLWQFMTSTGRGMGLRIDWWVDERRDPVRSTTAAAAFLKGLNEQFGSLYLAAAAYNGGPARVSRGLTRYEKAFEGTTGDDLFFALADKDAFRPETRDYVPQLIAAALVGKDPERYGISITPQPAFEYDSVRVGPLTPLAAVAQASASTVDEIRELNSQILRGMTPPKDSTVVRLPAGRSANFEARLSELPDSVRVGAEAVKSKAGETMAAIAKRSGLTATQLAGYNPSAKRLKDGKLVSGQTILVPTRAVVAAASSVPDPAIERYGSVVRGVATHVVKSGDNLGAIAKKYGTTVKALKSANALRSDKIFPGQQLAIPRG